MRPPSRLSAWIRLAAVIAVVLALDQISKALIESNLQPGERTDLLPGVDLLRILNDGVAFGFLGGSGKSGILIITAIALIAVLSWYAIDPRRKGAWLAVGMVVGGAVGNVIDRLRQDAVTDFISLPLWPTFNVADISITVGAIALVIAALLASEEKSRRAAAKGGTGGSAGADPGESNLGEADPGGG